MYLVRLLVIYILELDVFDYLYVGTNHDDDHDDNVNDWIKRMKPFDNTWNSGECGGLRGIVIR